MKMRKERIRDFIFIMVMALYAYVGINQGLSVVDTTYSMSNFAFFEQMNGTWAVATYLANAVGYGITKLPMAGSLLGFLCYARIIIVLMAVASYQVLKKEFPPVAVFLSQMIAIGLCWAPATVLYHYLTYFFLQMGVLLIYKALTCTEERNRIILFVCAGFCLGANIAVRMPNVTHAMLILAVWFGTCLLVEKEDVWRKLLIRTGWCLLGYAAGVLVTFVPLLLRFGFSAYPEMVKTLFAMTEKATDYKPTSMLTGMFGDYVGGLKWFLPLAVAAVVGAAVFCFLEKMPDNKKISILTLKRIVVLGYIGGILILLRLYWGRGMFDFRYYNYGAVYAWVVQVSLLAAFVFLFMLFSKKVSGQRKLLAAIALLQMFLIPLGGNNGLYPLMNSMFFVLPLLLGVLYEKAAEGLKISKEEGRISGMLLPAFITCGVLVLVLLVQSVGFHAGFALQDGVFGENRDTKTKENSRSAGLYTTRVNAELLDELTVFAAENGLTGKQVLLYGEVPGLGYLLDMPSAITTFWPDLDSYRIVEYQRDLAAIEKSKKEQNKELPVVITSSKVSAFMSEDAEAMAWFSVDEEAYAADEKIKMLMDFLDNNSYTETFANAAYVVFEPSGN